jgi:hypothetical protein
VTRDEAINLKLLDHTFSQRMRAPFFISFKNRAAVGFGTMPPIPSSANSTEWGKKIELEHIAGLVSLGTPHIPPPEGLMDMTRGALR